MKYLIEKNTVQETLVIPLFGRLVCSERFPQLFSDPEAKRICDSLDYDFAGKRKKMESVFGLFGALEVAQRQYDLRCEVEEYLLDHPKAAVVNLGCGLDDTFRKCDNGICHGYNIDLPDVIAVRKELLLTEDRERNICVFGIAEGEFRKSTSDAEEITPGWYTKEEIKQLLRTEPFAARTQAYCYAWANR